MKISTILMAFALLVTPFSAIAQDDRLTDESEEKLIKSASGFWHIYLRNTQILCVRNALNFYPHSILKDEFDTAFKGLGRTYVRPSEVVAVSLRSHSCKDRTEIVPDSD